MILVVVLSAIFEILPPSTDTHKTLLGENASREAATVHAPGIDTYGVFILLQAPIGIVTKQHGLWTIP